MKNIKWLVALASKRPLVFSLALLMIAVTTLSIVVANRDLKIDECNKERKQTEEYYRAKFDSLSNYYRSRELQLNDEVKSTLGFIIQDYRLQLEEQRKLNEKIRATIERNKLLIDKSKQQ